MTNIPYVFLGRMRRLYLAAFLIILSQAIYPEIVYLKNGTVIEGSVTAQNDQYIDLKTAQGMQRIQKIMIKRVAYNTTEEKARLEKEKARLDAIRREATRLEVEKLRKLQAAELAAREQKNKKQEAELAKQRAEAAKLIREKVEKKEIDKPDDAIGYWDFAWRSAVLPGWGHFAIGKPIVGGVYAGATVATIYGVYVTRKGALHARSENKRAITTNTLISAFPGEVPLAVRLGYGIESNRKAFVDYKRKINRYNYALGGLGLVYGVQMMHIILNGLSWESGIVVDATGSPRFEIQMKPEAVQDSIGYSHAHVSEHGNRVDATLTIPF